MIGKVRVSGFTLIEAIISSMLLALVIAGSYSLVNRSSALIRSGRDHYVAINIARSKLERIRNFQYDQLYTLSESNVVVNDSGTPASDGLYRRTTAVYTNYSPGLTKVEVRVDIADQRTLRFQGNSESVASLFTEYLTQ